MSRYLSAIVAISLGAALTSPARADEADELEPAFDPTPADRELGASLGVAIGGRVTAGGLRVEGHYLYQLADHDWFDGRIGFTFGGGPPACFRDRDDEVICEHDKIDGVAIDLGGGIRRWLGAQQGFTPWAAVGAAVRMVRFGDDDVTGFAIPLSAALGVRARVTDDIAVGGLGAIEAGPALVNRGLGLQPQVGLVIGATVEFALR
jgi:hypothetical protein